MILRINIKLFNHLKATILPYCFSGSTGMFMVAVKLMDTSSYWIFLCRNSFYTKATDSRSFLYSWKYNRSISLPSISSTLNNSLNPSISVICCLSGFCLFLRFFFSFSFFGQQRQLLQICKVWLIWPPQRIRTKWPYITNIEII